MTSQSQKFAAASLMLLLASGSGVAAAASHVAQSTVPAGTRLALLLSGPISSNTNHAGDAITLRVIEPLKLGGRTLVAAGTSIKGIVTLAQPSGRLGKSGRLGIEVQPLVVKGLRLPLQVVRPDSAKTARGKFGLLRRIAAPIAQVGRSFLMLGGRDPVPNQVTMLSATDPQLAHEIADKTIGAADALADVELASDSKGAHLAQRGARGLARVGGGYLSTVLAGPVGALHQGSPVEVPAGSVVYVELTRELKAGVQSM